jgi:hypothetical protein
VKGGLLNLVGGNGEEAIENCSGGKIEDCLQNSQIDSEFRGGSFAS